MENEIIEEITIDEEHPMEEVKLQEISEEEKEKLKGDEE